MILISHRGNHNGKNPDLENSPGYIDRAISRGYDVEVDLRRINGSCILGHDKPQYDVSEKWLNKRTKNLWLHCKNIAAVEWLSSIGGFNYFWHESDVLTLTSNNHIWAYPGRQSIKNSIAVLPEIHHDDVSKCIGICSDYISLYRSNSQISLILKNKQSLNKS
tara:strand:+ start:8969 stop:9457 length:489 start_codon:yes stop_codon:yes gene_type:complete